MQKDSSQTSALHEHGNIQSSIDYFLRFNIPKDAKILDIGCNYGSLINKLYEMGYANIHGIDVNKESIEIGKKKYPKISSRINYYSGDEIPFNANEFDVVLMFDVIEHIPNIKGFLSSQLNRVLKDNGSFIFQTPNKIINVPWEIIHKKSFTKYKKYHCSLQTIWSLKNLLSKSGFKCIVVEKFNVITTHNKNKIKRVIGFIGIPLLYILQILPLSLNPNFWGRCKK